MLNFQTETQDLFAQQMWTRELFFCISFFTFPSIYKSASFLRSSLPQKMKRASATVSGNCTPRRPHEGGACVPRLPHLPARTPGSLHSVYVPPGVCAIVNARAGSKVFQPEGSSEEKSLQLSPGAPCVALVVTCPPEPWLLACVGSRGGGDEPSPVSLIKSPLLRHPLALQLITIPLDLSPLLLNSNVMDLKSPACSTVCSLS